MNSQGAKERKCYGQICPMATALDVVGDRWTLLILRELLGGPARFNELEAGLPGIAKNLLTKRLRNLEHDGIVRRIKSHATVLYTLTEQGAAIRPTLEELGFWGAALRRVGPAEHDRSIRAIAMALQSVLVRAGDTLPAGQHVIELGVDSEHLEILLGARPTVTAHSSVEPDARIHVDAATVSDLLLGQSYDEDRFIHVSGNPIARTDLLQALGWMAATA